MTRSEDTFAGVGGKRIFERRWEPRGRPAALVVLAHGASEHSGRYDHVAEILCRAGIAMWAIDHRGHGRSAGEGARIGHMADLVNDLDTEIDRAAGAHPGVPIFLLGHSMGGTVALSYVTTIGEAKLSGLILSAPAAVLEAASWIERVAARALSIVAPDMGILDIESAAVSRDPEVVADYETDPLNHHGKLPARTVAELAGAIERFSDAVREVTLPLLVMHGTADRLVPDAASRMVHERAGSDDKTLRLYDGLYHEILNEPERDEIIGEIAAWIGARC